MTTHPPVSPTTSRRLTAAALSTALDRVPPRALCAAVFAAGVAIVFARRPDALLNAQFYAEDGTLWYARAHNLGPIRALFVPDAGYFQVLATGVAALSLAVPLRLAPLFFAVAAALVEAMPAAVLVSRRGAQLVASLPARLALAFLYLALPNTWTNSGVVTYEYWRLALVAFVLVLTRPRTRAGAALDAAVVALAGLSGPLVLLMLPVLAIDYYARPENRHRPAALAALVTSAVQVGCLLATGNTRSHAALGASVGTFFRLFTSQLLYGTLLGRSGFEHLAAAWPAMIGEAATIAFGLLGVALLCFAAARGPYALRLYVVYAMIVLGASLVTASVAQDGQWGALAIPGAGARYFLFGMLAVVASLVWLVSLRRPAARLAGALLLAATCGFGVTFDWSHPASPNTDFARHAASYEAAPSGTSVEIPINPPGWTMVLAKP